MLNVALYIYQVYTVVSGFSDQSPCSQQVALAALWQPAAVS